MNKRHEGYVIHKTRKTKETAVFYTAKFSLQHFSWKIMNSKKILISRYKIVYMFHLYVTNDENDVCQNDICQSILLKREICHVS